MHADDAVLPALATAPPVPPPPAAPAVRADDHGAFRGVDPVRGATVVLRPLDAGLAVHAADGTRTIAWDAFESVEIGAVPARGARVATARIVIAGGETLEMARMHCAGADYLPATRTPDGPPLLRVERMRLLAAAIVARAGLAPVEDGRFLRAPRGVPPVDVTPRPRLLPPWAPPLLLLFSVVGLVLVAELSLAAAGAVTAILFVHEYGHVIAMRSMGLTVRGVLFLPLLGAATVPEQAFGSAHDEARVALAGPLTALPLVALTVLLVRFGALRQSLGTEAVELTLALNALNLLPLLPLDGGRVLLALTAGLSAGWRRLAACLPLLLAGAFVAFELRGTPGLVAGGFVAFAAVVTRLAFRRHAVHAWMAAARIDAERLREALRDVTHASGGPAREDIDGGVPPAPMRVGQAGLVLLAYGGQLLALGAAAWLAHQHPALLGLE